MKNKINLGAGNIIMDTKEWINHDLIKHRDEIDVCFNLNEKDWFGFILNYVEDYIKHKDEVSKWLGKAIEFDEIRAWDVLEHLDDPINFFNNCWDLLKKDGILDMKVCGWQNPNAHVDLTHKRAGFDIRSFDYLDSSTELGGEYSYYVNKKWKIIDKHYDRKNNILIKLTPRKMKKPKYIIKVFTETSTSWDDELNSYIVSNKEMLDEGGYDIDIINFGDANRNDYPDDVSCINLYFNN